MKWLAELARERQKVLARLNIILRGTSAAHGDAVRTAGSFANQIKRLQAQLVNIGTTIGTAVMPHINKMMDRLDEFATRMGDWVKKHPEWVDFLFKMAAGATAAGVAFKVLGGVLGPVAHLIAIAGGSVVGDVLVTRSRAQRFKRAAKKSGGEHDYIPAGSSLKKVLAGRAARVRELRGVAAGLKGQSREVKRLTLAWRGLRSEFIYAVPLLGDLISLLRGGKAGAGGLLKTVKALGVLGSLKALGGFLKGAAFTGIAKALTMAAGAGKWLLAILGGVAAKVTAIVSGFAVFAAGVYATFNGGKIFGWNMGDWARQLGPVKALIESLPGPMGELADEFDRTNKAAEGLREAAAKVATLSNEIAAEGDVHRRYELAEEKLKAMAEHYKQIKQWAAEAGGGDPMDPVLQNARRQRRDAARQAQALRMASARAKAIEAENKRLAEQRELMEAILNVAKSMRQWNADPQQVGIFSVEAEADELKERARETIKSTEELRKVVDQIDRVAAEKIDELIRRPARELEQEVIQLRIEGNLDGVARDVRSLQQQYLFDRDAAAERGVTDPRFYQLLFEKYDRLIQARRELAAEEKQAGNQALSSEIQKLQIETTLDGLAEKLALLAVDHQRELEEATERGLNPDLVDRKYRLLREAARQQFDDSSITRRTASRGIFNARSIQSLQASTVFERTAKATEATARNTRQIEKNMSGGTRFS